MYPAYGKAGSKEQKKTMNNKLTRKDIEEMQAEIDHRKLVERPKLLEEVKETRAQGDLSENEREPDPLSGENDQDREDH